MDLNFTGLKKKTGPTKDWTDKEIEEELKKFDQKIQDAKDREGDSDVRDHMMDKGVFLKDEIRKYEEAEEVLREAYKLSGGASRKMEILFEILLMEIDRLDIEAIEKDIKQCTKLVEEGADWDKKNKLKIFEGVYCMLIRDFKKASTLFMSSIATFTCVELMSYNDFAFYCVITSLVTQDRKTLKKEVIFSPDILAVIRDMPHLKSFAEAFYNCEYFQFFKSFLHVIKDVQNDKYLCKHVSYFTKEMRLVAYKQYLESFKSVTIDNMARAFGVSNEFLDKELSNFIYSGKLSCKIDKVSGIIESNRPNKKAELFQNNIKQGDALLNRIQKLARALDI